MFKKKKFTFPKSFFCDSNCENLDFFNFFQDELEDALWE